MNPPAFQSDYDQFLLILNHIVRDLQCLGSAVDQGLMLGRRVAFAACGSSAIGLEAGIRDLRLGWPVLTSRAQYIEFQQSSRRKSLVIGVSFSGLSTEVLEIMTQAEHDGIEVVFLSKNTNKKAINNSVHLGLATIPNRYLPLAACLIIHTLTRSQLVNSLKKTAYAPLCVPEKALNFLQHTYQAGLTPLFASSDQLFLGRLLSSQYQEFLKKVAFTLVFPDWTHQTLWAVQAADRGKFAFIHIRPMVDLTDHRFEHTIEHLQNLGISQIVLDKFSIEQTAFPASYALITTLQLFHDLAQRLDIAADTELSFEST